MTNDLVCAMIAAVIVLTILTLLYNRVQRLDEWKLPIKYQIRVIEVAQPIFVRT